MKGLSGLGQERWRGHALGQAAVVLRLDHPVQVLVGPRPGEPRQESCRVPVIPAATLAAVKREAVNRSGERRGGQYRWAAGQGQRRRTRVRRSVPSRAGWLGQINALVENVPRRARPGE
jgi:hypothetical protein